MAFSLPCADPEDEAGRRVKLDRFVCLGHGRTHHADTSWHAACAILLGNWDVRGAADCVSGKSCWGSEAVKEEHVKIDPAISVRDSGMVAPAREDGLRWPLRQGHGYVQELVLKARCWFRHWVVAVNVSDVADVGYVPGVRRALLFLTFTAILY